MSRYRLRFVPDDMRRWKVQELTPAWRGSDLCFVTTLGAFFRRTPAERLLTTLRETNEPGAAAGEQT